MVKSAEYLCDEQLTHKKSTGTVFFSYRYEYDNAGNIIKINGNKENTYYTYDDTYRLIRADYVSINGVTNLVEEFTYNPAGNMIEYKKNGSIATMQYDVDDKLTSDNEYTYAYDLAGKLQQKIRKSDNMITETHEYNWMNRTKKITTTDKMYEYKYDILGRRIWKGTTEGTTLTGNVSMFFDNDDAYQEYIATGTKTAEYMFSGRIDEPLLMTKGDEEYTYHQNHLGTIIGISGANESLVNEYEYTAYGQTRTKTEGVGQPYTYTAREPIGDTSFYYYRARIMNSRNGVFVSHDTAMDGFNWYAYVGGNSVMYTDPYGLVRVPEAELRQIIQDHMDDNDIYGRNFSSIRSGSPYNNQPNPLNSDYILAIIYWESNGDDAANNTTGGGFGARGLMQIRDPALTDHNNYYNPDITSAQLFNRDANVAVGVRYLGMLWNYNFGVNPRSLEGLIGRYHGGAAAANQTYVNGVLAFHQAIQEGYNMDNNTEIFDSIRSRLANGQAAWPPPCPEGQAWVSGQGCREEDIWGGDNWSGDGWSGDSWSGDDAWSGDSSWSGNEWSGDSWSGNSWSGNAWPAQSWSGNNWPSHFTAQSWSGNLWSGNLGELWSGNWSSNSWSGNNWPSHFTAQSWSGNTSCGCGCGSGWSDPTYIKKSTQLFY